VTTVEADTDLTIEAHFTDIPSGPYKVQVYVNGKGYCDIGLNQYVHVK
jgi:hypothetical protein